MAPFCLTIHLNVLISNSQDSKTIWKSLFSLFVQAMLSSGQGRSLYRRFEKKPFPDIYSKGLFGLVLFSMTEVE